MKFPNSIILITALLVPLYVNAADSDGDGIDDTVDNCQLTPNQDQRDTDRDFFGNACDADLNNDGVVGTADLGLFRKLFRTTNEDYDFNEDADLDGDGVIGNADIGKLRLLFGKAPGPRGLTPAELDPPTLVVDTANQPGTATIPAIIQGGAPRSLTRISSSNGQGFNMDIVENEVILISSDPQEKDGFLTRWNGTVVTSWDMSLGSSNTPKVAYVIRVDHNTVDTSQLNTQLATVEQHLHGDYKVSSANGLKVVALLAQEKLNNGLNLSLNILLRSADYEHRSTTEGMTGDLGPNSPDGSPFSYVDNSFLWPYMDSNPDLNLSDSYFPLDTGVAEAWRILGQWRGLAPQDTINPNPPPGLSVNPNVVIFDGGFIPNADLPGATVIGVTHRPNPDPNGCGRGAPALPGSICYWHGSYVAAAGFAMPDNNFGAAGPGGPVSRLILHQSPSLDFGSIVDYLGNTLTVASMRPRILNMSFATDMTFGWWFFGGALIMEGTALVLEEANILVVAAAGNHNRNLDESDNVTIPCEVTHVVCVGGTDFGRSKKADLSNFGNRAVDIFAPGELWTVDAESADSTSFVDDHLVLVSGTSFATPFVSGVAALILSADPLASNDDVRRILRDTAHTHSADSRVTRRINALGAVRAVMGNTIPYVSFTTPEPVNQIQGLSNVVNFEYDDLDDERLFMTWRSDIDGALGSSIVSVPAGAGASAITLSNLSPGLHTITLTATDNSSNSGRNWTTDTIQVFVDNPAPTVGILQPTSGQSFFLSSTIPLRSTSHDENTPTGPGPLQDNQLIWFVDLGLEGIALGHSADISAARLGVGTHSIRLQGIDHQLAQSTIDSISITIIEDPINLPPDITIISPIHPTDLGLQGATEKVYLDFSVVDPEGDSVTWVWYKRVNGGVLQGLNVQSEQQCLFWNPIFLGGGCGQWITKYFTILDNASTEASVTYTLILAGWDEFNHVGISREVNVSMTVDLQ